MKKIALLTDGWRRYLTYSWIDGVTSYAKEIGLDVKLFSYNTNGNLSHDYKQNKGEYALYNLPKYDEYDGIIFDCTNTTDQEQIASIVERLKTLDVPVVSISYYVEGFHYVGNDNKKLFRTIVDHMYFEHGCRNMVFAGGPDYNYENIQRFEAFCEAMSDYGIQVTPEMYMMGDFDFGTGERYLREWIEAGKAFPDAFICANDNIAAGICAEADRRNIKIPETFKVTGFDNLDKAAYYLPQITTVDHNRGNIGRNALDILVKIWNGEDVEPYTFLHTEMICGESCGCPNNGRTDYRLFAKWQIDWGVTKDVHEEHILELESSISECNTFEGLFSGFAEYIRTLDCSGIVITVDKELLCANVDRAFTKCDYNRSNMEVVYAEEKGKKIYSIKNENELDNFLLNHSGVCNYIFFPIHFRDDVVGYTILLEPNFLYDSPFFYDVHSTFIAKLEEIYKQRQLAQAVEEMKKIYNMDSLTHLYNRHAYTEMITPRFEKYCEENVKCAMVFFDVDRFKYINDTYGHDFGDKVLSIIAGSLKKNKPKDSYAYRFGGDEFVVFFPYATQMKIDNFTNKVISELTKRNIWISCGSIITDPNANLKLSDYLVSADERMYMVKENRHNELKQIKSFVKPNVEGTDMDDDELFLKGVDISSLPEREDSGAKFYNHAGIECDAFEVLKENNINSVRLRIWNDPSQYPESNGYCDLAHTIEMAKRIKANNMHFMLDFHYSDYWADPGQQRKPKAWEGLSFDELIAAVYEYTEQVLAELSKVDALPDIVQIGNEIRSGMIFPEGEVPNYSSLAALINAGIRAVRDFSEDIKVMIHLDQGGRYYYLREWFDAVFAAGMEKIDAIGISYYSFWHGTFSDLKNSIKGLIDRYDLPVYVVETAHPWRHGPGEHVSEQLMKTAGFKAGAEEQKKTLELVMQIAYEASAGKETGIYYWEPLCITNSGFGSWDQNMGMLDDDHKQLVGFEAYRDFDTTNLPIADIDAYIEKLYLPDDNDIIPAGENIISNGDFSDGFADWWVIKSTEDVIVEVNNKEVYVESNSNFTLQIARDIRIDLPGKYELLVDYRGTNTTGVDIRLFIRVINCDGETLYEEPIYPSDIRYVTHRLCVDNLSTGVVTVGIDMKTPPISGRIMNFRLIRVE